MGILKRLRRLLLGYEVSTQLDRVGTSEDLQEELKRINVRLDRLHDVLVEAGKNPLALWLYANRSERMDANLAFFERSRREFHLARYRFAVAHVKGKDVADIACGTGYGCDHLRCIGEATSVVGVDNDAEAIRYAESTYGCADVTFKRASGHDTGLADESLDVVTSFETIEHLEDDGALLREFSRILRPGGLMVISTPNQWPCETHPHHVREYDRGSFASVLSEKFEILEFHNQNSGSSSEFNRGQPAGIVPTTDENQDLAECYVAVCRKH